MSGNKHQVDLADEEIDISKILFIALKHWYLFAIALAITMGIAWFYNWYTHPVYRMSGTVLVKDDKGSMGENLLAEIGALQTKRNIENEIEILRSRSLIGKALKELNVDVTYIHKTGIRERELYNGTPVLLEYALLAPLPWGLTMEMEVLDSTSFSLTYPVYQGGDQIDQTVTGVFNESFETPYGEFRVKRNRQNFNWFMETGDRDLIVKLNSTDGLISLYQAKLNVQTARHGSSILTLTIEENVKQKGVDILNKMLEVYIENSIELKNKLTSNSLRFIDAQLEVVSEGVSDIEGEMEAFRTQEGVSDLSAEASFFLEQVGQYDQQISSLDIQISFIEYLEKYISEGKDFENSSPSSLGINDPLLIELIARLSELEAEKDALLKYTKSDNPLVTAIDTKISTTKASLLENVSSIKGGLEASKAQAKKQLAAVESKAKLLPAKETELIGFQRKHAIQDNLLNLLLEKKSENEILLASTVSDNLVIDQARSTVLPVKPVKNMSYGIGFALAMIIPAGFLLLRGLLDSRIKDRNDLQRITDIPLIGMVNHNDQKTELVVASKPKAPIAESFRAVRTNLQYFGKTTKLDPEAKQNVILLTSSIGSEGKSFCSMNLSTVFAMSGKRTILVGLDLRKPKLAEHFQGVDRKIGVSGYLAGFNEFDQCIQKTGIDNFDIMVSGEIPPNPSEMIMSEKMDELVDRLSGIYDYVIIDTPPIGLVTDAMILSKYAMASIYVVRQNFTVKGQLDYVNDLYEQGKLKNLSVLFNAVKFDSTSYGYSYGYGYGYGYYEEDQNPGLLDRIKKVLGRA